MAWYSGEKALKSLFSENFALVPLKDPLAIVSNLILAGHTVTSCFKKLFLYVVSVIIDDKYHMDV